MPHVVVIALIFGAYVALMGGLLAYIASTARPRKPAGEDGDGEAECRFASPRDGTRDLAA